MANYTNPMDFIQPLLSSPVTNINAGINEGMNIAKLQPTIDSLIASTDLNKAQVPLQAAHTDLYTQQARKAKQDADIATLAFSMIGGTAPGQTLGSPQSVEKVLYNPLLSGMFHKITGVDLPGEVKKINDLKTAANIKRAISVPVAVGTEALDSMSGTTAPVDFDRLANMPSDPAQRTPEDTAYLNQQKEENRNLFEAPIIEMNAQTPRQMMERESRYKPELAKETFREDAAVRREAATAERDQARQADADRRAERLERLFANKGEPGTWSYQGIDEATKLPIYFNNKTRETVLGDRAVAPKPRAGGKKDLAALLAGAVPGEIPGTPGASPVSTSTSGLKPITQDIVNQIKKTARTREEAENMARKAGYDPSRMVQ